MMIDNNTRQKLTENLNALYPIIVTNSSKSLDEKKIIFSSAKLNEKTQIVFFTKDEWEIFRNFIDTPLSIEKIKKNFSKKFIENILTDNLHQLLRIKANELDIVITEQLNSLEKKLSDNIDNEWLIIFPLENIRITDNEMKNVNSSFKIASSTIYRFNQGEKERIEKMLCLKFHEVHYNNLNDKICIETKVVSGDIEKAEERGYSEVDEAINFLRLFIPWLKVDVEGCLSRRVTFIEIINVQTKHIHTCSFGGGEIITNQYYLNQNLYEYLDKNGLFELNKIYETNDSNEYANKLKTAIR